MNVRHSREMALSDWGIRPPNCHVIGFIQRENEGKVTMQTENCNTKVPESLSFGKRGGKFKFFCFDDFVLFDTISIQTSSPVRFNAQQRQFEIAHFRFTLWASYYRDSYLIFTSCKLSSKSKKKNQWVLPVIGLSRNDQCFQAAQAKVKENQSYWKLAPTECP